MALAGCLGAAVGRNRGLPLLAVLVAGVLAGLGGGMIRDMLLGVQAASISEWYYLPAVVAAAFVGGFLAHPLIQRHAGYLLARGVSAGFLVTIGVQKGLAFRTPADAAILLGVICGCMGGATADVFAGERAAIFRRSHWGLLAIIVSAIAFWLFTTTVNFWVATLVAVSIAVTLDSVSWKLGWNSPMFPGEQRT